MSTAGFQLLAGRIPGETIAYATRTSSVGTFTTTETVADTVTAALVSGRTYKIEWFAYIQSSVAGDAAGAKIRLTDTAGTQLTNERIEMADSGAGYGVTPFTFYTAASTGNQVFVGTFVRSNGTGNLTASGGATQIASIQVTYVSG